jgi:hypothetical protein
MKSFLIAMAFFLLGTAAFAGTCPSGANYVNTQSPSSALTTLSAIGVTNCFFIGVGGSDSNDGASEATGHPWLHAPGMSTCSANCASHTVSQHDGFIVQGGYVLHTGNSSLSPYSAGWSLVGAGGSSSTPVYYGVDPTWYSGGSWVRPLINQDNPTNACPTSGPCPVASCSYSGHSMVTSGSQSYIIFDDFELTGLCASAASGGNEDFFHFNGPVNGSPTNPASYVPYFFVPERNYMHGWTYTAAASGQASSAFDGNSSYPGAVIQLNVVDGTDADSTSLSVLGNNDGDAYIVRFNIFKYQGGDNVSSDCHIVNDNVFSFYYYTGNGGGHGDQLFCEGEYVGGSGAPNLFYNNSFHDIGTYSGGTNISYVLGHGDALRPE